MLMRGYYQFLLQALKERRDGVTAMIVEADNSAWVGQRVYLDEAGEMHWPRESTDLTRKLIGLLRHFNPKEPTLMDIEELGTVYLEPVRSGPRVLVLGGGHISQALARILAILRYHTTIVDDRIEFANQELFPTADRVICGNFLEVLDNFPFDNSTFAVIVTRGHQHDYSCLRSVIGKPTAYTGMIGSRKKVASTMTRLEEEGIPRSKLETVYAPIGVSIAAQTPEEIAVSISGQIIQVYNQTISQRLDPAWVEKVATTVEPAATATVVLTRGSSPREAGARMLILQSGQIFGTVGGGSGEAAVCRAGADVIRSGQPLRLKLDMNRDPSEAGGMICGGMAEIFIEPLQRFT